MQKKLRPFILSAFSTFLLVAAPEPAFAEEAAEDFSLTIFHTNDMHASIDDFGKIAHFLDTERANVEHSLYLDAGDIFSGNPVVDLMDGIPMIELLNEMQLDLLTIGNHEFDYGQEIFQTRRNESNFEWMAANMHVTDPSIPITAMKPYEIFNFEEVTVGVVGITEAPPATAPAGIVGLAFDPYIITAQQYSALREEVDILIALNHIGIAEDRRMAEAVDFFDVIIGGHSHTTLSAPEVVNGTPIVHSGSHARNVGVLDLTLDKATGEVAVEGKLQPVSELTDVNSSVQNMVDQYNAETEELLNVGIGHTLQPLNRDARWEMDVSIGNLITDALRNFADTDIALTNNGGIRASIAAGEITARDILTVDPFGNVISIVEMTGRDIKEVIAYSFHRSLENYGPQIDLQTSGLNYTIYTNDDGTYADSELFIHGEPMDLEQSYTIATNNFIIEGGDGYDFSKATMIQADQGQVTQALIQYIQEVTAAEGAVDYAPTEGRIQTKPLPVEDGEIEQTDAEKYTPSLAVEEVILDLNDGAVVLPKPQTLIANLDALPEKTTFSYLNAEAMDLTGAATEPQVLQILITYPDHSTDLLEVALTVIPVLAEEEPQIDEEKPVEVEEDLTADEETAETAPQEGKIEAAAKSEPETDDLPKTGETNYPQRAGLVVLLVGSGLLAAAKITRKEKMN